MRTWHCPAGELVVQYLLLTLPREEDENEDAVENRQLPDDIVDEKPEYFPNVVREEQADIAKAMRQRDRHKLIVAPTGSGKTYTVAKEAARILTTTKDKVAIVVPSKDLMKKVVGRLANELGTDDISRYGAYMVESQAALSVGKAVAVPTASYTAPTLCPVGLPTLFGSIQTTVLLLILAAWAYPDLTA